MGDQVTSISLLTAAMEINNVIGHALEETPLRGIKESLLLPPCDVMKTLKDGVFNQNKPFIVFYNASYWTLTLCCKQQILIYQKSPQMPIFESKSI